MIPDGGKIASLRNGKAITQEKLAAMSNVTPRTIQRLEASSPGQAETINQVAASLEVMPTDIIRDADTEDTPQHGDGVILKPNASGLYLMEQITASERIDFDVAFEPWPEQTTIAMPFLRRLEELHPHTFGQWMEYDWALKNSAAARVTAAAALNVDLARLAELKPEGLHVLFGRYAVLGPRWRQAEEGNWYTRVGQADEILQVAALRITPIAVRQRWIPIQGKPITSVISPDNNDGYSSGYDISF